MHFRVGLCIGMALVALSAMAGEAVASPSIDGESVSGITETDATLQAQLNPHSLENGALYQFQIVELEGVFAPKFACSTEEHSSLCIRMESVAGALPWRVTKLGMEDQAVSLDLAQNGMTLEPGTTYDYRVIAAVDVFGFDVIEWEEPIVYGKRQTFTTASPGEPPPDEEEEPLGGEEEPPAEEEPPHEPEWPSGGSTEEGQSRPAAPPDPESVPRPGAPSACHPIRHHRSHRHRGLHVAHARKLCAAHRS